MKLKLRWWNKKMPIELSTAEAFFSLTDPVYSLMLMGILGDQYYVWDKEASINFIKPGQSDLYADFLVPLDQLEEILRLTANGDKCFPEFIIHVKDKNGNVVSEVQRKLYVRKKPRFREESEQQTA
ncbi:DUF4442 domain-containing protein [Vibrio sinaloensis]|nr:DUF4442 domain-containing protein [Vibrio sinaloensis]